VGTHARLPRARRSMGVVFACRRPFNGRSGAALVDLVAVSRSCTAEVATNSDESCTGGGDQKRDLVSRRIEQVRSGVYRPNSSGEGWRCEHLPGLDRQPWNGGWRPDARPYAVQPEPDRGSSRPRGEVVKLDGGTLILDGEESSSVVLRLAPWRARSVGRVLASGLRCHGFHHPTRPAPRRARLITDVGNGRCRARRS
jgi:hypothetical protein